jgi:hypothetical protein
MKFTVMRWEHAARLAVARNAYKTLFLKSEGKRPIKMDLQDIICAVVNWI